MNRISLLLSETGIALPALCHQLLEGIRLTGFLKALATALSALCHCDFFFMMAIQNQKNQCEHEKTNDSGDNQKNRLCGREIQRLTKTSHQELWSPVP